MSKSAHAITVAIVAASIFALYEMLQALKHVEGSVFFDPAGVVADAPVLQYAALAFFVTFVPAFTLVALCEGLVYMIEAAIQRRRKREP